MTSAESWENSPKRWLLPPDADPDERDNLVTAREYGYRDAQRELSEKVERQGISQYLETTDDGAAVATDGGTNYSVNETGYEKGPERNEFDCPNQNCEAENFGYPDQCPECGGIYNWPEETE